MQTFDIHPIALCQGPRDSSHFAYRDEPGTTCNTACYVWYLAGPGPKILVDAGDTAATFLKNGTPETDVISIEEGLGRFGLKPEDIDIVIATHLHCDHIALGYKYKNAAFIVQKSELDYAKHPHPIDAGLYQRDTMAGLNWRVIDGDGEIIPGVSVMITPGHSPGGQSVQITTKAGRAIITGFCCTYKTFSPTSDMLRRGWEVTIPLIHHDALQTYNSVLKVKKQADIIIPVHDPGFIGKDRLPDPI